jgi:hypothetical protein
MALKTSSYGTCHQCKALNMAHRTTCYRCGTTIAPPISTALSGHAVTIAPKEPVKADRRQVRRHDVTLPGSVLAQNGDEFAKITVRNIGVGGLLFDSEQPFQLHDQLILRIEMEGEAYVTEAVVKHCGRVLSNVTPYSSGVEFTKPDGAFISCIARMDASERETWS